ncbi:MAG: DUF5678 domain-containing protein [Candidatus Omnitrophota bacterium]|nr:DUF5678 domain-containing protein [Candidatus Omnitrophota bacterium]
MEQVLVKENKYNGRYVVVKDFDDSTVIADGKDPKEAYDKAVKQGYPNPVIFFIPAKDMVQIY